MGEFSYPNKKLAKNPFEYQYSFKLDVLDNGKITKRKLDPYELQYIQEEIFDETYDVLPSYIASFNVSYAKTKDGYFFNVSGKYTGNNKSKLNKFIKDNILKPIHDLQDDEAELNTEFVFELKEDLTEKKSKTSHKKSNKVRETPQKKKIPTKAQIEAMTKKLSLNGYDYAGTEVHAEGNIVLVRFNRL